MKIFLVIALSILPFMASAGEKEDILKKINDIVYPIPMTTIVVRGSETFNTGLNVYEISQYNEELYIGVTPLFGYPNKKTENYRACQFLEEKNPESICYSYLNDILDSLIAMQENNNKLKKVVANMDPIFSHITFYGKKEFNAAPEHLGRLSTMTYIVDSDKYSNLTLKAVPETVLENGDGFEEQYWTTVCSYDLHGYQEVHNDLRCDTFLDDLVSVF